MAHQKWLIKANFVRNSDFLLVFGNHLLKNRVVALLILAISAQSAQFFSGLNFYNSEGARTLHGERRRD